MDSRRIFLGKVASGLGTLAAVPGRVLGANDRIRVGFIGFGERATALLHHLRACPNAEAVAFADVNTAQLERARGFVPDANVHSDYRRLLEDSSIDAVIIATPQHLHAAQFCEALDAGKHVYLEKTLAFTLEDARRARRAFAHDQGRHVVEIGHQPCSSGHMRDARMFLSDPARMGKITAISMRAHRDSPRGVRSARADREKIDWDAFLGDSPKREFDANRYLNWRNFVDYSGGNIYENLSQQLAFWYTALRLRIADSATAAGGIFLRKDGRELPDTISVAFTQPEEMLISWSCGTGNSHPGAGEMALGDQGTIARGAQVQYFPEKINRPEGNEMTGRTTHVPQAHMQDFLDAIRANRRPSCPFETGWRVSIACRMALESCLQGRTVRWDAEKEEIV